VKIAGIELGAAEGVGGGMICAGWRALAPDGRRVFAKTRPGAPPDFFTAEAAGLELIRGAGGPPVPTVRAAAADGLVLDWVEPGRPDVKTAREFGRRLAGMHNARPQMFGAVAPGYIGSLPLDNTPADDWPAFYAERRLVPYLRGLDREVRAAVTRVIDRLPELAGPAEPPARIHGDLWSGNLLWAADGQVWLVDAAGAHGGHRETDLAMLALFGAPLLDEVVASYQEVAPLADGWRDRQPLHQLHPLLVHAQMFGGGYPAQVMHAACALCP
jgi:fructosamine-3-kinase